MSLAEENISRFFHIHHFCARRIGNRHRQAAKLRHRQKGRVKPGASGHTERYIREPEEFCFKGLRAPIECLQCFLSGMGVGGDGHNQTIHNKIIFGKAVLFCFLKNILDNGWRFWAVCGNSPSVRGRRINMAPYLAARGKSLVIFSFSPEMELISIGRINP